MVPLAFRGATFGVLVAIDRVEHGPHFSTEDEQLLEAFATSAATAIATAESVVAERRGQRLAAAEQERTRWARELHDETLQGMAALRLALGAALRSGKTDAIADAVRRALEELDEEIAVLRALITDLRPAALDQIGAEAAIEALADRCRGLGLEVDVHLDLAYEQARAPERLDEDLEIAIYRIVQEALTNARKHGGARRAVVEVREGEITVDLSVRDDGSGFEPSSPTDGFGIAGMRERVDLLNGTLTISSTPGNGTTVSASFPARRRRDGRDEPRSIARGG